MTPAQLAAWAERAGADEQRAVLASLRLLRFIRSWEDAPKQHEFTAMLDCGAFESAAISLVPGGWVLYGLEQTPEIVKEEHTGWEPLPDFSATLLRQDCAGYRNRRKFQEAFSRGYGAAFALAIAAAIARTMED